MDMLSLRLADAAIASRVHPRTGEPIVPLGFRPNGRPIWPIMGGSGEEDDANDSKDEKSKDEKESDDDEDDPEDDESGEGETGGGDDRDPQKKIEALNSEKDRQFRRRKEAEKRADDLQAELDKLKNKDIPELDQLKTQVQKLQSENEELRGTVQSARLENAFLQDNTYEWHNPSRALALADLTEVEIDDDGKVSGLKAALDKLVESDPYLVKEKAKKVDPPPKSGEKPKDKGKDKVDEKTRLARLQDKYPGLRR